MADADTMVDAASTAAEASMVAADLLPTADAVASQVAGHLAADQLVAASEEAPHLGALAGVASKVVQVRAAEAVSKAEAAHAAEAALGVADTDNLWICVKQSNGRRCETAGRFHLRAFGK